MEYGTDTPHLGISWPVNNFQHYRVPQMSVSSPGTSHFGSTKDGGNSFSFFLPPPPLPFFFHCLTSNVEILRNLFYTTLAFLKLHFLHRLSYSLFIDDFTTLSALTTFRLLSQISLPTSFPPEVQTPLLLDITS